MIILEGGSKTSLDLMHFIAVRRSGTFFFVKLDALGGWSVLSEFCIPWGVLIA
jgi:hypothetical protein